MKYNGKEMDLGNLFENVMKSKREDIVSPANRIVMTANDNDFNLNIDNRWNLPINNWGRTQLDNRLAAGLHTFSKEIPKDLYVHNVNRLLVEEKDEKFVLRTLSNGDKQHVRAVVSDQFMPIDNNIILPDVIDIFGKYKNRWLAIGGFPTDVRTYVKFVERKPAFTLTDINGNKREYRMGVMWRNSEVGSGYMEYTAMVIDGFCNNGVMFGKFVIAECKFMHKGSRINTDLGVIMEERVQAIKLAEIKGLVCEASKIAAEGMYGPQIKEIMEQSLLMKFEGKDKAKAVEAVFRKVGLNDSETENVKMQLGGDFSAFGLQAAVTKYAQSVDNYDRRVQLEEAGGNIVSMPSNVWKSIAALSEN